MSRSKIRWVRIPGQLRNNPQVRIGTMIGFVLVSMPAAWLLSMFAR